MNIKEETVPYSQNCLALTVKKDYRITIARNVIHTAKRVGLKISLSILLLNFLNIII